MMSINNNKTRYAKIDMRIVSLYELFRWSESGILEVNSPETRKLRWSLEGKSQLIESVLEGIPVQAVFLGETEDGKFKIIDGTQRIKTILEYMQNGFHLLSDKNCWNRRRFIELNVVEQRRVEDFQLVVYIIRNDNEADIQELVFDRLNLYQQKFLSQEIRNYKYRNQGIPFIRTIADSIYFQKTLQEKEINFNSLQHQELALRFMSFYYKGYQEYRGNMKDFLDDTLKHYAEYRSREDEFRQLFECVFRIIWEFWEDEAFLIESDDRRANLALYDVVTYSFARYYDCDLTSHMEEIKKLPHKLLEDNEDFRDAVKGISNTSKRKVNTRFTIWMEKMKIILGEKNAR